MNNLVTDHGEFFVVHGLVMDSSGKCKKVNIKSN